MSKSLALLAFLLFSSIAIAGWWKKQYPSAPATQPLPLELAYLELPATPPPEERALPLDQARCEAVFERKEEPLPQADRIEELFRTSGKKLPIVETISYKSRTDWLKGRPAWISDYAAHHRTSRHFIARSLHGPREYLRQEVSEGDRFNVYRSDLDFQFNLVIDLSRRQLGLYYQRLDTGERELIKSYRVGLGRPAPERESKLLTPIGQYLLGSKVAIFAPGIRGFYNGEKAEMIRLFGTRWIPFDKEIGPCSEPAKGYGIHGAPWRDDGQGGLKEELASLDGYTSDGCVHLAAADMEELFAIILARPAVVELVMDHRQAQFPPAPKE